MDILFESFAARQRRIETDARISLWDVWLQSRLLCSLQWTKEKDRRVGSEGNEKLEENKAEDKAGVIISFTTPHSHTHTELIFS
jgi:hypothetical protein